MRPCTSSLYWTLPRVLGACCDTRNACLRVICTCMRMCSCVNELIVCVHTHTPSLSLTHTHTHTLSLSLCTHTPHTHIHPSITCDITCTCLKFHFFINVLCLRVLDDSHGLVRSATCPLTHFSLALQGSSTLLACVENGTGPRGDCQLPHACRFNFRGCRCIVDEGYVFVFCNACVECV